MWDKIPILAEFCSCYQGLGVENVRIEKYDELKQFIIYYIHLLYRFFHDCTSTQVRIQEFLREG